MASEVMETAALGRPFTLGMLYDARRDELIPGVTLWDNETLKENTMKSSQPGSTFEISASDSIESKSTLLDVNASLKASFLSGLIEVGGSAKYLNDSKKFKNQSRVTFQYKATTDFRQLSTINLETKDIRQKDMKSWATHMVTGILYGANAVFVFDSEKLDHSSVQDIQGSMEAVIKKIPTFDIEGKVEIKLTDEEKALTDKFSCKFYGDFILESNPATFKDAVKTYVQLPKLLGKNGDNAVPLKVTLMPLNFFCSEASEPITDISDGLVRRAQDVLEDLQEVIMRCNDSLFDRVVENFPPIEKQLQSFQNLCHHYKSKLQKNLADKLPAIREGKEKESSAEKLFEDRDKSPFSQEKLSKWLDDKEREINIIKSCVDIMGGIKIVKTQSDLDEEVLAPGVEDALCFVFTSLESGDPYLDGMEAYLDSREISKSTNEDQWYHSYEVTTKMREKAEDFHHLAKALRNNSQFRFLIAAITDKKYKGATIYHYKDSRLATDGFSKPKISNVKEVTDRRNLIWYACDLTLDPDTAHVNLSLSKGNKKATNGEPQSYRDLPQRFDHFPQVLCKEGLTGQCYWEVEWSTGASEDVCVGVCYSSLYRKGESGPSSLGWNSVSWCLGHKWSSPSDATLFIMHAKVFSYLPAPPTGCTRLGVFLDWSAGTLSYYNVSADTVSHLHTFKTNFSEPVYPAFTIWREKNYVFLSL